MSGARSLPTGVGGRILALGLTFLVLVAVWVAAVQPLADWYADRADSLAQRTALARRMTDLAASLPALAGQLTGGGTPAGNPPRGMVGATLAGNTDAVAGADLQQRVQEMAVRAGVTVTSTETLPAAAAGAYRRIALHLSVNATWPVLVALLQTMGQASPRMLIDDLQVRGSRLMTQPAEPPLEVSFTVFGFRADTPATRNAP